jgi:UDP-glucose 4-epimerase
MAERILVTGGCGFIGANLVPRLVNGGYDVVVLDSMVTGNPQYLGGLPVKIIEGDINDEQALRKAIDGATSVVHLAAAGSVVDSVANPAANFRANAEGTFHVLDAARAAAVNRFVFSSTGGALIGNATPPVDEQSLPKPISPYGASKLAAEAYCHAYAKAYGLHTVATRFANVYGPFSGHKKGAITAFFRAASEGKPIVVYGDGQASRDFMYVDDICAGIELALTADVPAGSVYHLATGVETTVNELADLCRRVAGVADHPIEHRPTRPGEVERNFASYDRARDELGFQPQVGLASGLESTWRWLVMNTFAGSER